MGLDGTLDYSHFAPENPDAFHSTFLQTSAAERLKAGLAMPLHRTNRWLTDLAESQLYPTRLTVDEQRQEYADVIGVSPDKLDRYVLDAPRFRDGASKATVRRDAFDWAEAYNAKRISAQGPDGFKGTAARFLGAISAEISDPVMLGANAIPIIGNARYLKWINKYGKFMATSRVAVVEGLVGTALTEPLYAIGERELGVDTYTAEDAFFNTLFGVGISFGLHHGLGKLGDLLGGDRALKASEHAGVRDGMLDIDALSLDENSKAVVQRHVDNLNSAMMDPTDIRFDTDYGLDVLRAALGDLERGRFPDVSYAAKVYHLEKLLKVSEVNKPAVRAVLQDIIDERGARVLNVDNEYLLRNKEHLYSAHNKAEEKPKPLGEVVDEILEDLGEVEPRELGEQLELFPLEEQELDDARRGQEAFENGTALEPETKTGEPETKTGEPETKTEPEEPDTGRKAVEKGVDCTKEQIQKERTQRAKRAKEEKKPKALKTSVESTELDGDSNQPEPETKTGEPETQLELGFDEIREDYGAQIEEVTLDTLGDLEGVVDPQDVETRFDVEAFDALVDEDEFSDIGDVESDIGDTKNVPVRYFPIVQLAKDVRGWLNEKYADFPLVKRMNQRIVAQSVAANKTLAGHVNAIYRDARDAVESGHHARARINAGMPYRSNTDADIGPNKAEKAIAKFIRRVGMGRIVAGGERNFNIWMKNYRRAVEQLKKDVNDPDLFAFLTGDNPATRAHTEVWYVTKPLSNVNVTWRGADGTVLRGGRPVMGPYYHPDTLNIDETLLAKFFMRHDAANIMPAAYESVRSEFNNTVHNSLAEVQRLMSIDEVGNIGSRSDISKIVGDIGSIEELVANHRFYDDDEAVSVRGYTRRGIMDAFEDAMRSKDPDAVQDTFDKFNKHVDFRDVQEAYNRVVDFYDSRSKTSPGKQLPEVTIGANSAPVYLDSPFDYRTEFFDEIGAQYEVRDFNMDEFEYMGVLVKPINALEKRSPDEPTRLAVRTKEDGKDVIYIAAPVLREKFRTKAWANSQRLQSDKTKSTPLAEDQFKTEREFRDFVLAHEYLHTVHPFREGKETRGQYEDRINSEALYFMSTNDGEAMSAMLNSRDNRPYVYSEDIDALLDSIPEQPISENKTFEVLDKLVDAYHNPLDPLESALQEANPKAFKAIAEGLDRSLYPPAKSSSKKSKVEFDMLEPKESSGAKFDVIPRHEMSKPWEEAWKDLQEKGVLTDVALAMVRPDLASPGAIKKASKLYDEIQKKEKTALSPEANEVRGREPLLEALATAKSLAEVDEIIKLLKRGKGD